MDQSFEVYIKLEDVNVKKSRITRELSVHWTKETLAN